MIGRRPVTVSRGGFLFCRISVAVALWAAYAFRWPGLVVAAAAVLAASALLGVGRAPLVVLFDLTAGRLRRGRTEVLDERGMRFAHALGALFATVVAVLLYTAPGAGRIALALLCLLKTSAALGACSALKLYECATNGACCARRRRPPGEAGTTSRSEAR